VNRRYPTFKDASECPRCSDMPSARFILGLEQFNRGEFFAQHETLEDLWIAERDEVRSLYKGILQVGVGFHHLFDRHNYKGAVIKLESGCRWLRAFQPRCRGVEVTRLIEDTQRARTQLMALGPERMSQFDRRLVVKVQYAVRPLPMEVYHE
jgi:predicted metal-dependent hydrolase